MAIDPTVQARIEEANRRHFHKLHGATFLDTLDLKNIPNNLVIRGMRGLGDNVNQRAFLRELKFPFYLDTPWPELYRDFQNVSFVACDTFLRTQNKNIFRQAQGWFKELPEGKITELKVVYGVPDLQQGSMYKKLSRIFGNTKPALFDVPHFDAPLAVETTKPIAIIRPVTVRKEWAAVSRNPDPKYIYEGAQYLMDAGFFVVSVADIHPGEEWLVGQEPPAHLKFHAGELSVSDLMGLCDRATVLFGGVGWIVPVAMAMKKSALILAGGYGGCNSPHQVADPDFLDVSWLHWIFPDRYCKCSSMTHDCDKRVTDFKPKFDEWLRKVAL